MLDRPILVNIALFMERTTTTGKEALAWTETYQAVTAAINAIDAPKPEPPKMVAP